MSRRYSSFLLRCWSLEEENQRIEIEQVQSGAQVKLDSMDAAFEWIEARLAERAGTQKQMDLEIESVPRPSVVPSRGKNRRSNARDGSD